ncbi:MAG: hypothetical protein ABI769_17400 [Pseudomonadota bacterium]
MRTPTDTHRASFVVLMAVGTILVSATGIAAPATAAQPAATFADVFGSGMVLPHDVPLTITGQAAPRQKLTLQVDSSITYFAATRGAIGAPMSGRCGPAAPIPSH